VRPVGTAATVSTGRAARPKRPHWLRAPPRLPARFDRPPRTGWSSARSRVVWPRWPTPMTATRKAPSPSRPRDAGLGRRERLPSNRRPRPHRQPVAPPPASPRWSNPDDRTSNRMSWPGLATFTTRVPRPARLPARAITASVPSMASTATTAESLTTIVCPMSRPPPRPPPVAELEVRLHRFGRPAASASPAPATRSRIRRIARVMPVSQHAGHGGDERIRVLAFEFRQHRQQRSVGPA
jgi:hypothetical protein